MPFTDATALRNHLANVLQPYLGEWANGTTRIHIVPPSQKKQARTKAEATTQSEVECILRRLPDGEPRHMSGGQRAREAVYSVQLVNYADDTKLVQAMEVLALDSSMQFARPRVYISAVPSLGTLEQVTFFPRVFQVLNQVVA